jgi:uncharacterized protein (TIGR02246 family)
VGSAVHDIQRVNDRFCEALGGRDLDALMEYYADDVSLLIPGAPAIEGSDAVRAYYENVFAAGVSGAEMRTKRLEERGDLLVEHGEYTMSLDPPGGEPTEDVGKYTVVHRKDAEGRWRCWFDMFHSDSAAG